MQASSSSLAPPQASLAPTQVPTQKLHLRGASVNLGGGGDGAEFMNSGKGEKTYKERLPREMRALLDTRAVVTVTELNPRWFEWLMTQESFTLNGRYRAVHDGHDCAIFWDSVLITPTDRSASPQRIWKKSSRVKYLTALNLMPSFGDSQWPSNSDA